MVRRRDAHVHWKHLAAYGLVVCVAVIAGGWAIWSFIEKQSLTVLPEALPKITVLTGSAHSRLAAAWVGLLSRAGMQATLVPLEKLDSIEGVVLLCDLPSVGEPARAALNRFVEQGGAVAFAGVPPRETIGGHQLSAELGPSDDVMKFGERVSPLLARIDPGYEVRVKPARVPLLEETPRMTIDARWKVSARAAVMHVEEKGARTLWIGFDPDQLFLADDPQLRLTLRNSFRWLAGQPVSDGAAGVMAQAHVFEPAARVEARQERFAFSADRTTRRDTLTLRMTNRGTAPIENPTVIVWLPPRVTGIALSGNFVMRRNATLLRVPGEGACVISLPILGRNEDRTMRVRIAE